MEGLRATTYSRSVDDALSHSSQFQSITLHPPTIVMLQVLENSPAHRAGLEAYFDFIVSIDGIRLVSERLYYFVIIMVR